MLDLPGHGQSSADMPEEEIGTIKHYYNHIEVGLIELTASLKVGDTIHIKGAHDDFTQAVESMQIELRESDSNRRENYCCGGGCGEYVLRGGARLRQKAFEIKKREFDESGAEAVVTSCVNCRINLMIGAQESGWRMPVLSLVETVAANLAE